MFGNEGAQGQVLVAGAIALDHQGDDLALLGRQRGQFVGLWMVRRRWRRAGQRAQQPAHQALIQPQFAAVHAADGVQHDLGRRLLANDAEVVLNAIRSVHRGELWLDQGLMGRLLGALTRPAPAPAHHPEANKLATLTAKERKIIALMVEGNGASNKDLALRAFVAEHTLRNYLTSIYQKLGVANRLELYVYATKHGLDQAED